MYLTKNFNLLIQDIEWIQHHKILITYTEAWHFPAKNKSNAKADKTQNVCQGTTAYIGYSKR